MIHSYFFFAYSPPPPSSNVFISTTFFLFSFNPWLAPVSPPPRLIPPCLVSPRIRVIAASPPKVCVSLCYLFIFQTTPNPNAPAQAEVNSISFDQSRHGPDTIRIADSSGDPHNYGDLSPPEAVRQLQNSPAGYTFKDTLSTSDPGRLGAPDPLGLHLLIHRSGGVHTPPLSVLPCSPVSPRHHHIKPRAISDTFSSESSGSGSTESLPELGDESDHHRQVCATRSITNCGLLQRRSVQGRDDSGAVFVPPAAASLATTNPVSLKKEPGSSSTVATPPVGGAGEYTAVTKSNSSPRSDSTSERSNSDIEIYLDTHNLNNSVMRMTSVGNNNSTLGGTLNQDPCGSSAPPPTTHPAPIEGNGIFFAFINFF